MRRVVSPTLIWGLVLLAASGLMLLARLGAVPTAALLWTVVFAAVGGGFGVAFLSDARYWWAAIPAGTVLGLAVVVGWNEIARRDDDVGGALFLASVALGFWAVLARDRRHRWAAIPGGVVSTLALVAGLSGASWDPGGAGLGAVFLLGLAATFALVAAMPAGRGGRWAYVPAAVLAALGLLVGLEAVAGLPVTDHLGPAALAVIGLVLIWRSVPHGRGRR